jgi:hypothetical protein
MGKMTKARWFALALCIAVALTLVAIPVAGATTQRTDASGVWSWGEDYGPFSFDPGKTVGGNQFFTGYEYGGWTGTFTGTSYEPFHGIVFKSGTLWAIITINFEGTVLGQSGTAVMKLTVNAPPDATMGGRWVIVDGSGGLRRLHGSGSWIYVGDIPTGDDTVPPDTSFGDYEGTVWMH